MIVYTVVEMYDGEYNVDICGSLGKAIQAKEEYISGLANFDYNVCNDEERYFCAELHDMLYTVEIIEREIL